MITVKDLLAQKTQRAIYHVVVSDTVQKVLEMMREHTIRAVVVLKGLRAVDTVVNDIMTADVTTVSAEDSVDQCMHHMTTKSIRHLPVCKDGKVIGMVSVGDVVKELIRHQAELIGYLEGYIRGRVAG
jgi:predicted transcriptional regulator